MLAGLRVSGGAPVALEQPAQPLSDDDLAHAARGPPDGLVAEALVPAFEVVVFVRYHVPPPDSGQLERWNASRKLKVSAHHDVRGIGREEPAACVGDGLECDDEAHERGKVGDRERDVRRHFLPERSQAGGEMRTDPIAH